MSPRMEFFKNAQNFSMGNVEFNTVQGDYHDYRVRNVRNTFGNKNRYSTNYDYSYNDHSTNYAGDYHAPATHHHAPVNNFRDAQNVNSGNFYGTFNQGTMPQPERGGIPPRPAAPAGPNFSQHPPPGSRPGPGPIPNDRDFTASSTAIPQHQGFQQQRGPPNPEPPHPMHRPQSGPPMPEGNRAWQQQQHGPPPAFPPRGPQGYPQHPPQNPSFRPAGAPFPLPQQHEESEQWPGQYSYKRGMVHLKQNSHSSWDMNSSGSSDTSDEDESETDEETMMKAKRMKDPNRPDRVGMNRGPSSQPAPDQPAPQRQQPHRWSRTPARPAAVPTLPPRESPQPPMSGLTAHLAASGNPTRRPRDIPDDSE